jgi:hypothetical protein
MHALFKMVRDWQQRRRLLAAQRRRARGCQIIEDMPVLLLERGDGGHHRVDKPGAPVLGVPKLPVRQRTPGQMARSAALFEGSTPA